MLPKKHRDSFLTVLVVLIFGFFYHWLHLTIWSKRVWKKFQRWSKDNPAYIIKHKMTIKKDDPIEVING